MQVVYGKHTEDVVPGVEDKNVILEPNYSMSTIFADIERLLNRLTGLNRFQSTQERALRMALRISFLERALLNLAEVQ